jgi:hypothetical protein
LLLLMMLILVNVGVKVFILKADSLAWSERLQPFLSC